MIDAHVLLLDSVLRRVRMANSGCTTLVLSKSNNARFDGGVV